MVDPTGGVITGTIMAGQAAQNKAQGTEQGMSPGRGQLAWSTGGLSEIPGVGGVLSKIMGGKNADQQQRDQYRELLRNAGIYDQNYNLTLTDGSKVNMGLDGSIKNYNVDFSKQGIDKVVAYVNPLSYLVAGGNTKMANDLAGELTNAIYNTKDPAAEARALYQKFGITGDQAIQAINKLGVDDKTKQVFAATINQLGLPNSNGGNTGDVNVAAQADEVGRLRAATQGFISKIQQDAAAQQAANRQAVKDNAAQQAGAYRSNLLQNMLQDNTKPIAYPTSQTTNTASSFLSKLPGNVQSPQMTQRPAVNGANGSTMFINNPAYANQNTGVIQNFNSTLAKILGS